MRAAPSDSPPPSRKVPAVTGQASLGKGTSASTSSPGLEGVSVPALGGQGRACSSRRSLPTRPEPKTRARSRPLPFFARRATTTAPRLPPLPRASPRPRTQPAHPRAAVVAPSTPRAEGGGVGVWALGACAGEARRVRLATLARPCARPFVFFPLVSLTSPCPPGLPHAHSPTAPLPTHHVQARHRRPGPGRVRVRRRAVGEWGKRVQRVRRQWRLTRGG